MSEPVDIEALARAASEHDRDFTKSMLCQDDPDGWRLYDEMAAREPLLAAEVLRLRALIADWRGLMNGAGHFQEAMRRAFDAALAPQGPK